MVGLIIGMNLVIGFVGYFVAFLFAYGFRDEIVAANHLAFLVLVGGVALVAASLSTPLIKNASRLTLPNAAKLTVSVSISINLLAVGVGSMISARYKDEGSVSAAFSTSTDVLVAGGLFAGAIIASWFVWRSLPTVES